MQDLGCKKDVLIETKNEGKSLLGHLLLLLNYRESTDSLVYIGCELAETLVK